MNAVHEKKCSNCGGVEPLDAFHKRSGGLLGRIGVCKECSNARVRAYNRANPEKIRGINRKNKMFRNYGLTPEGYAQILSNQNQSCDVCGEVFSKTPHIDHNHKTGNVRGLLCVGCNIAAGSLRDDPARAMNLAAYLIKHTS